MPAMSSRLTGPVEVVGAGLLGTSVALACRRAGLDVLLSDSRPSTCAPPPGSAPGGRARPRTGRSWSWSPYPRTTWPRSIVAALEAADAVVTDVGSVKSGPLARSPRRRRPRR